MMMRILSIILVAISACSSINIKNNNQTCWHTNKSFNCVEYVANYDGDTVTFNIPRIQPIIGELISIRVRGIDTAEIRSKDVCESFAALRSKEIVATILKNARLIHLTDIERGKYFRIVANIEADGLDLASYLLERGLAVRYDGGKKQETNWCLDKKI